MISHFSFKINTKTGRYVYSFKISLIYLSDQLICHSLFNTKMLVIWHKSMVKTGNSYHLNDYLRTIVHKNISD